MLSRIPGAATVIRLHDPQDSSYQTVIVVTKDASNNEHWSLYDFGADGRLSNDDRAYAGGINVQPTVNFIGNFIITAAVIHIDQKLF
mgnify:CR=1 FL=1